MKRRRLLGLLCGGTVGLAGCIDAPDAADAPATAVETPSTDAAVGTDAAAPTVTDQTTRSATDSSTPPRTTAETPTETPGSGFDCPHEPDHAPAETPGEGWPDVAVETDPSPYDEMTMDATVVSQFTDDCPAVVRVSLTNISESAISGGWGWSYPFSAYWNEGSQTGGPEIDLLPIHRNGPVMFERSGSTETERESTRTTEGRRTSTADGESEKPLPTERRDGCWSVDSVGVFNVGKSVTVDPGETISEIYAVFNSVDNVDCLPAGEYRFVQDYYGGTHDGEFDESWGITLELSY